VNAIKNGVKSSKGLIFYSKEILKEILKFMISYMIDFVVILNIILLKVLSCNIQVAKDKKLLNVWYGIFHPTVIKYK